MPVKIKIGKRPVGIQNGKAAPNAPGTPRQRPKCGPGCQLEKLLAARWIATDEPELAPNSKGILGKDGEGSCRCKEHAREMDAKGADWCLANQDVIAGWMKAEAKRRGWWVFSRVYARHLVRKAVKLATAEIAPA